MKIFRYAPTNPTTRTTTDEVSTKDLKKKLSTDNKLQIDVDITVDKLGTKHSRAVIDLTMDDLEVLHQNYTDRLKARIKELEQQLKEKNEGATIMAANLDFICNICDEAPNQEYDELDFFSYLEKTIIYREPQDIDKHFTSYGDEKAPNTDWLKRLKANYKERLKQMLKGF